MQFTDWNHYESVLTSLEALQEDHLDNFELAYPNLTEDELDDKEEEIGFIYYEPYINFETSLNFSSLRAKVEAEIVTWLDNNTLVMENSPNRKYRHSVAVRTLLNEEYNVIIGTELINLAPSDNFDNRPTNDNRMMADCWKFGRVFHDEPYDNNNRMFEVFLEYDSWPFVMKAHAEITNFKRRNNGKWRRSRKKMDIDVLGNTYNEECSITAPIDYDKEKRKKRKSLDVRVHIYGGAWKHAKDFEVTSNYSIENSISGFVTIVK